MSENPATTNEEPVDYRKALSAIADRDFIHSDKYLEQQWRARRVGAHHDILLFEAKLVKKLRQIDVPAFAHCVWRTPQEQHDAFVRGVTKARPGESPHNHGCAVDIIHGTRAWGISKMSWAIIGHLGKEIARQNGLKLTWGGDWSFYDPAHWELTDWRNQKRTYVP